MPGLQGENVAAALGSPVKKNKLSLKFFQKKETKRALDFSEPPADELKSAEPEEPEDSCCDQVVPCPSCCPASPIPQTLCEKRESLVPFVGLNNLGNTCYLNSILQVLYYCPGLREGIKDLYSLSKERDKPKEEADKSDEEAEGGGDSFPAYIELLGSFNSLIASVEQLQSSFLLNPDSFSEGELSTAPRKILHTLRELNSMYQGYLQHDAQEVLQCILGYIQEACDTIRKEKELETGGDPAAEVKEENVVQACSSDSVTELETPTEEDGQGSGKRKSDTEAGNAKKKPKSVKSKQSDAGDDGVSGNKPFTRSKRKSSTEITTESTQDKSDDERIKKVDGEGEEGGSEGEGKGQRAPKETDGKRKKKARLSWLRPSVKQPSIFSKFRSMGKISCSTAKNPARTEQESEPAEGQNQDGKRSQGPSAQDTAQHHKTAKSHAGLDLMERLFQGSLVLRTRCLECESYTERREGFQDISVPVQDDQPSSPVLCDVSPDPKPELKTLQWAIAQFASVERIVGEDKYFCETCHHYTEAERSLLFDKTPEVITIHLKRFSASSLELDPYVGLSKVNTPLQTPLTLSLEEWCTRQSGLMGQHYELFAVVMHSGVTISSGHYTTYIRMSDLKDVKLWPQGQKEAEKEEEEEGEGAEQKAGPLDYDDGEVSFSVGVRGQRSSTSISKAGNNIKLLEGGVGLLGGQRSLSRCELSKQAEKDSAASDGCKRGRNTDSAAHVIKTELKKAPGAREEVEATEQQALHHLLTYEGKWLLFDDSEVRMFEEEDFLRACSPQTCSSSTPYLLFYRRRSEPAC